MMTTEQSIIRRRAYNNAFAIYNPFDYDAIITDIFDEDSANKNAIELREIIFKYLDERFLLSFMTGVSLGRFCMKWEALNDFHDLYYNENYMFSVRFSKTPNGDISITII